MVPNQKTPPPPLPALNPSVRSIMVGEVAEQCLFAMFAADDLNAAGKAQDIRRCWFAIQNMLTASAVVSKLLWGDYKADAGQRKVLRDRLGVGEGSPLKSRSIRNHFEHIDERIIQQFGGFQERIFMGRNMGPKSIIRVGTPPEEWFLHLDPTTREVTFWHDSVSLQDVMNEIVRIHPVADAAQSSW